MPSDISIDFFELEDVIKKEQKKIERSFNKSIKNFTVKLVDKLFTDSPVDTGLYRSNHNVSIGQRFGGEFGITDRSTVVLDAKSKINEYSLNKDNLVFIQNNLDYAERLENGYSRQAPSGIYGHSLNKVIYKFKVK